MRVKILSLLITIALFISCEENESTSAVTTTSVDLVGTWNITALAVEDASLSITEAGEEFSISANITGKDYNATAIFAESPNRLNLFGSLTLAITLSIDGQTESEELPIDDLQNDETISWNLTDNLITLTDTTGEISISFEIVESSENRIQLQVLLSELTDEALEEILQEEGVDMNISGKIKITLEK